MTADQIEFVKQTSNKAVKVVESCTTAEQLENGIKFVDILQDRYIDLLIREDFAYAYHITFREIANRFDKAIEKQNNLINKIK